jgi:hypothetical protein
VFGTPAREVTAWGIQRIDPGKTGRAATERLTYADAEGVHVREWPLSELTPATVRDRWGAGQYKVLWFVHDPSAENPADRYKSGGGGPVVQIEGVQPVRVAAPRAAAPAAAPLAGAPTSTPVGLESWVQFMALADQRAQQQLASIVQLAGVIGGSRRDEGIDVARLLEQQQTAFERMLEKVTSSQETMARELRAEIAAVRADAFGDDDDEDEEPAPAPAPVPKPKPFFRPGEPAGDALKAAVLNWVAENPDQIFAMFSKVPAVLAAVAQTAAAQQQQQAAAVAPPPPPPAPRPVARVQQLRPVVDEQPPPPPSIARLEGAEPIPPPPSSDVTTTSEAAAAP